jgi:hypothetical protein
VPTPAFEWNEYEVPTDDGGNGLEVLAAEAAPVTVTVALPDLSAWPSPLAKAEILLQSAAEVEHALMVQYLYAAYSLGDGSFQGTAVPANAAQLTSGWRQAILGRWCSKCGDMPHVNPHKALF